MSEPELRQTNIPDLWNLWPPKGYKFQIYQSGPDGITVMLVKPDEEVED